MRRVYLREWRLHRRQQAKNQIERKQWSLEAVGARIGLSHGYLGRVERGERPYNEEILEGLAREYGCSPAELLSRQPQDPQDLWSILEQLREPQRRRARDFLEGLRAGGD